MSRNDRQVPARITDYLTGGGLWNPELANHQAVRDLLIDARDIVEIDARELQRLQSALYHLSLYVAANGDDWVQRTAREYLTGNQPPHLQHNPQLSEKP